METKKKIQAYWFGDHLKYGDGRIPRKGRTHRVKGHPRLCNHGLHASVHPLDALYYASCPTLWMVELSGEMSRGEDKLVATERTYIKRICIDEVAYKFARWCALRVLNNWETKPPYVVIQYLKAGDKHLRSAAKSAAKSAAESAAKSAAESAAKSAAWSAAESAAWSAAWSAAKSAAESAAKSAAWSAAESAAWSAAWSAARSAAESAARSEERKAQRRKFKQLVKEAFANAS